MQPVLTPDEARALDDAADAPVATLMERAGLGLALAIVARGIGYGNRVTVLAGPGNNGGDGYVAARHLRARGVAVEVLSLGEPRSRAAAEAAASAAASGVPVRPWREPDDDHFVVDALFGAGFRGPLPAEVQAWVGHPARVVAVDLPSGLSGETGEPLPVAFRAEVTVTFHAPKRGHLVGEGPDLVGELVVVDIGLPASPSGWYRSEDEDVSIPPRDRRAHKWSAGTVAVVGGAPGIAGAPVLAGRSALAAGAGAALVLRPPGLPPVPSGALLTDEIGAGPELRPDDTPAVLGLGEKWASLVLGPGLGRDGTRIVPSVVERWSGALVLDADALTADSAEGLHRRPTPAVVTPHAGEFKRIAGADASPDAAERFAREHGCVVLLKGGPTFVTDGVETWVVDVGGPELATIGTGDVLAGMLGTFLAIGMRPLDAAKAAAHIHGRAGAALAAERVVTADALVDAVAKTVPSYVVGMH